MKQSRPHACDAFLAAASDATGHDLRLVARYTGGEQGAVAVATADGHALVLKWSTHADAALRFANAAAASAVLQPLGYPLPRYVASGTRDGTTYILQTRCAGRPLTGVASAQIPRLLALNALQRDRALAPDPMFAQMLRASVYDGGTDYCRVATLAQHSTASRQLLQQARTLAAAGVSAPSASRDLVHFDFHPGNILHTEQGISAVIDWDGCCVGDCVFDLVTLLFYTDDAAVRAQLWAIVQHRADRAFIGLCLAHLVVRQVDWAIRRHPSDAVIQWLGRAEMLLREQAGTCGSSSNFTET